MFSKPAKPVATRTEGAEAPLKRSLPCSLVAENVAVKGDLVSDGDVQLDGALRGDLKVGHLSLGATGQVEGAIEADTVEVRGRVVGTITAQTVRLFATAHVDGDITHAQLSVEAGAYFAGRSVKLGQAVQEQLNLPIAAE